MAADTPAADTLAADTPRVPHLYKVLKKLRPVCARVHRRALRIQGRVGQLGKIGPLSQGVQAGRQALRMRHISGKNGGA